MYGFPLVKTRQYQKQSKLWLETIRQRENMVISFLPKTDRIRRIPQMLEDKVLQKSVFDKAEHYHFLPIDFEMSVVEDAQDLFEYLLNKLNSSFFGIHECTSIEEWIEYFRRRKEYLTIIVPYAERLLEEDNQVVTILLGQLMNQYSPTLTSVLVYEVDFNDPKYTSLLSQVSNLFQNIYDYPLYDASDTRMFMQYLQKKWSFHMSTAQENRIIGMSGGHFWLVKQLVREVQLKKNISVRSSSINFRLRIILSSLTQRQQRLLEKLIKQQDDITNGEFETLSYLKNLRLVDENNNLKTSLLKDYITEKSEVNGMLEMNNGQILLSGVPVDNMFSRKEHRVLKVLLDNRGQIVAREVIATHIWPVNTQDHYSDWAIDQLVARVRKRMMQLLLSPKMLKAVRGKGYRLTK